MDLTALLLRAAARRPHVLLVPAPGGAAVRLAVEAELARRGWPLALAPADADILAVAGVPGPELSDVVETVWEQVPAPRASAVLARSADVRAALDHAAAALADAGRQRSDAAVGQPRRKGEEHTGPDEHAGRKGHGGGVDGHAENATHSGGEHGGHEEHGGGGHHGHHGGGMALPGGLSMADLGEDRDGLTLDRLHVVLGPVLPDWPAGLVVRVTLQGDVIQEAVVELLDPGHHVREDLPAAVIELDGLARFLGVAGWVDAAARCRAVRDRLQVAPTDRPAIVDGLALVARMRRSRLLRWSLRGARAGGTDVAELAGHRLASARDALDGVSATPRGAVDEGTLASALVGAEFAAARLIVAVMDLRTGATEPVGEAGHG